jgi:hypothetical protein
MNQTHMDALADAAELPSGTIHAEYSVVAELEALGYATPYEPRAKPQITRAGRIALHEARTA